MLRHRILFIDAYDSFSNSIIALLESKLPAAVQCIKIDDPRFVLNDEAFFAYLHGFDAVVAGPGPGHPDNAEDVGLISRLWCLPDRHILPVLGICLGFQSLCLALGAEVRRLVEPRHGLVATVKHCGHDIFKSAGLVVATQYHSLHVHLGADSAVAEASGNGLEPNRKCQDLVPLAWDTEDEANGTLLMAARHRLKPFWGVQYHPESICTNEEGQRLVEMWWKEVCAWDCNRTNLLQGPATSMTAPVTITEDVCLEVEKLASLPGRKVEWSTVQAVSSPSVRDIVDMMGNDPGSVAPLLLESGTRDGKPVNSETGRFSIIGLPSASSMHVQYFASQSALEIVHDGEVALRKPVTVHQALSHLDDHMRSQNAAYGPPESPFWGGLIGFISYEAGLETINVSPPGAKHDRPDMWFVFVDRSIVVDHVKRLAYVQSVHSNDDSWISATSNALRQACSKRADLSSGTGLCTAVTSGPSRSEYCRKVRACQSQLRMGESYELCLTDQSTFSTGADSWAIYSQLRDRNPAPFGAYFRLQSGNATGFSIAGCSPERFLSWSRQGRYQFRPIKGTVKKTPGTTRARAEELLSCPKERAENLMIVDLIRHDLAGVPGISQVRVPKLMSVEEYETVFQLVSVIEGDLERPASGSAALAASLPPGSMTGAPKKRSCELLQQIEGGKTRGLYSGVLGYFDVGGGGDFSVVNRTAFKWDDEEDWRVGAGGAITALSQPDAEWEEMVAKRDSVFESLNSK